jgi:3,4-dihydroxy 2-butanone 4-phosphate synthase / GTP cyclohydrolase II
MTDQKPPFASVEEALEEIRAGRMIVLVDDEDRENEGDLTMAAEKVTPEAINFMAKFGRGLICLAMTEQRCDALGLAPITPRNTSMFGTPFCEPIDARRGTTTGTSAADRAATILAATDPDTRPEDLARPGHVYTLRARNGGVLVRAGQTEASVDLARLAGLDHSGVICEVMNDDGSMARIPQLVEFCHLHNMKLLTVADLIRYRMQNERHVRRIAESVLPTRHGNFRMIAYASDADNELHVALVRGDLDAGGGSFGAGSAATSHAGRSAGASSVNSDTGSNALKNAPQVRDGIGAGGGGFAPLVRVHSHCLTGDAFGSTACDCYATIDRSLAAIAEAGRGVFVYLHHTGRGFQIDPRVALRDGGRETENGELPRIRFHDREETGHDLGAQRQVQRESGIGAQILIDLGLRRIRVLTNHPRKVVALDGYGLEIVDQVPLNLGATHASQQDSETRR